MKINTKLPLKAMKLIGRNATKTRQGWAFLTVTVAVLCLTISVFFITGGGSRVNPEVRLTTMPVTSTITWYTATTLNHAQRLANAFTTDTGIGVEIVRDATLALRDRLMAEFASGPVKADVVNFSDVGTILELKNSDHLMYYDSPNYEYYPKQQIDPGYWAELYGFAICMAYDENRIDRPPQEWTDLLDENWRGRIGLEDINIAGSQYGQYYMLREKLGVQFWEKLLSAQNPRIYKRTEELADALLRGEVDIAAEFSSHIVYEYRVVKGTSLQGVYPQEGLPFISNAVAIIKETDQPEEAREFFDFLLSKKGQELMQRVTYRYSLRTDVASLEGIFPLSDLKILRHDSATEYLNKRADYIQEFNNHLTGRQNEGEIEN